MNEEPIYVNNDLFLGRTEEQKEFRRILPEVLAPPHGEELPYVVLLYGGGGMGKTTLAHRFYNIAKMEAPCESICQTLWIDWEEERNKHTPLQVGREHIRADVVFDRIHVAATQEGWGRHFKKYQKILKERGKVEQMVAKALTGSDEHDELGRQLAEVGTAGIAKLIRFGVPRIGDTGEAIAKAVVGGGVQIGAVGLEQAKTRLKAELDNDQYQLFLNPEEQMSLALADGLGRVTKSKPLLIFFDTYEIIDHADIWVREVIKAAGARLLWVIAGRQDLAQSRQFGNKYFRGYRETFSRRLLTYNVPQLAQDDLRAFFTDVAPDRLLTDEQAATISQTTRGIPLAIKTAAEVWQRGVLVEELVGNLTAATPHSDIVSHMTARYLLHVVNDEEDRHGLYALALAQGDVDVLTAMMRPADETLVFDLPARLATLSRRYAAVQLSETRLHDEPAAFLTAYLREPTQRNSEPIKQMNERAAAALQKRLDSLEKEMTLLEERAEEEDWVQTVLALTRTLFWLDEQRAWQWLIPHYVEGMAYSRDLRRGLLNVAAGWQEELNRRGRHRLKILKAANGGIPDIEAESEMLKMMEKLVQNGWLNGKTEAEHCAILDLRKGILLYHQEQYTEAAHAYEIVETGLPQGGERLQELLGGVMDNTAARLMWSDSRNDAIYNADAARLLTKVVTWLPDKQRSWYKLGVVYWKNEHYDEAINAFNKAIEIDPKYALPHNGLGNVYQQNGRFDEAINAYKMAIELDPKYATPHNGLGNVYAQNDRFDEAIHTYKMAIELSPKSAPPHNGLGNVYDHLGHFGEAIDSYKTAIEIDPKFALPHNSLGNVYAQNDRFEEAVHAFNKAIKLDPKWTTPHNNLGNVYRQNDRYKEAITAYEKAIEIDPKFALPHNSLGNVYAQNNRFEEAIGEYSEAAALNPKWATPHNNLGDVYIQNGRYKEAIAAYKEAVTLDPTINGAHYNLALLHRMSGDFEEAISACQQIIATDSEDWRAQNGLGYLYIQTNNLEQAELHLNKAIEIKGEFLNFLNLGIVKWRQSEIPYALANFEEAMDILNETLNSEDADQDDVVAQGWLQVVTGNKVHGLDIIRTSLAQKQDFNGLSNLRDWTNGLLLAEQPPDGLNDVLALVEEFANE